MLSLELSTTLLWMPAVLIGEICSYLLMPNPSPIVYHVPINQRRMITHAAQLDTSVREAKWKRIATTTSQCYFHAMARMGECFFATGGPLVEMPPMCLQRYNPSTSMWTKLKGIHTKRDSYAVAATPDHLFVMGGIVGLSAVAIVEMYRAPTCMWYSLPMMNMARSDMAATTHLGCIYVMGGFVGGKRVSSCE